MATSVKLSEVVPSRFVHLTPPDEQNIERIRADLETGTKALLNAPHVFKNEAGKYELLAGHDRSEAARRAGWTDIPVRDFTGLRNDDDVILAHFCRENLLRKEISKAAIAGEWLRKHPEWSDGKIADASGCSQQHVGQTRAELGIANPQVLVSSREGRDGKTREYKPRQVRGNVPSGKTIPHPTAKKPVYESPAAIADALTQRKTPETVSTETTSHPDVSPSDAGRLGSVGPRSEIPTGVDSLVPETAQPVEVVGSVVLTVLASLPAVPTNPTKDDLAPLTKADVDRLVAFGRWAQMCAARWAMLQTAA